MIRRMGRARPSRHAHHCRDDHGPTDADDPTQDPRRASKDGNEQTPRPHGRDTQEPNELDRAVAIATPLGLNSPQPIADIDLAVPSLPRPFASTALFLVPILKLLPNRLSRALRLTRTREQSPLPEPPPPPPQRLPPSPPHKPHYHHHHHCPSSDPPNSHHTHRTSPTKAGDQIKSRRPNRRRLP